MGSMEPETQAHHLLGKDAPEALEVTEAARQTEWRYPSFVADLFMGRLRRDLVFPFPQQDVEDARKGSIFLAELKQFLQDKLDPDAIDRTREIPAEVLQGLARLGCFGMKIPTAYGGLGLSQTNYNRAIELLGSYCGSTTVWLSAHQSIGAPQPLMLFGTEDQKKRYLPRLAKGTVSAFALTETEVGSDPANMETTATPEEDGNHYVINGQKLWCTNGPVAEIVVVMARTPSVKVNGRERKQITAFIVEKTMPGFEVVHRCDFMGLKGIQNGVLRFNNVRVPKENIILGLGKGMKLALTTLNAGRIAIPAGCVGTAKQCLRITRKWASTRKQWGTVIGRHEAVAVKIGEMAATTFAMESIVDLASALVDRKTVDIRLEAAIAKLYCSEACWLLINDALQIRGGRGYETADSLKARGEEGIALERIVRDSRINTIIEGTSDIMRLFIAREALDAHMNKVKQLLDPSSSWVAKLAAFASAAAYYAWWLPLQWIGSFWGWARLPSGIPARLRGHLRFVDRTAHSIALKLFLAAMRHQTRLAYRQRLLGRLVDIGGELLAMVATCSKAAYLNSKQSDAVEVVALADLFCRGARRRIRQVFREMSCNEDREAYRLAQEAQHGRLRWLEDGIV